MVIRSHKSASACQESESFSCIRAENYSAGLIDRKVLKKKKKADLKSQDNVDRAERRPIRHLHQEEVKIEGSWNSESSYEH